MRSASLYQGTALARERECERSGQEEGHEREDGEQGDSAANRITTTTANPFIGSGGGTFYISPFCVVLPALQRGHGGGRSIHSTAASVVLRRHKSTQPSQRVGYTALRVHNDAEYRRGYEAAGSQHGGVKVALALIVAVGGVVHDAQLIPDVVDKFGGVLRPFPNTDDGVHAPSRQSAHAAPVFTPQPQGGQIERERAALLVQ